MADIGLEFAGLDPRHDPLARLAVPVEILLQGDLVQRRVTSAARVNAQIRKGRANFNPLFRIRSSSVADHTMQPKNTSAISGTTASRTKPEGQSAIASSKVATDSVKAEIATAAASAARTEGPAAAVVV